MHRNHRKRAARTAMHAALAGVFSLAATTPYAASEVPPEQAVGSVEYRVGGIGADEAEAMRRLSSDYPLTLTFVERSADGRDMFTANVDVTIADRSGNAALDIQADGPMLVAELPDGRYTIEATLGGQTRTEQVEVAGGQNERIVFVWPEQSPQQLSRLDS